MLHLNKTGLSDLCSMFVPKQATIQDELETQQRLDTVNREIERHRAIVKGLDEEWQSLYPGIPMPAQKVETSHSVSHLIQVQQQLLQQQQQQALDQRNLLILHMQQQAQAIIQAQQHRQEEIKREENTNKRSRQGDDRRRDNSTNNNRRHDHREEKRHCDNTRKVVPRK